MSSLREGLALVRNGVARLETPSLLHAWARLSASEAYLVLGASSDANTLALHVLEEAHASKSRGFEARALYLLGEGGAGSAQPETARARYLESMALARELGMRLLVAHCHLGLGKLYRRTGKREQAHEHLTIATRMYREMDMRFWLDRAEAELRGEVKADR
jgi:hypothetical protein